MNLDLKFSSSGKFLFLSHYNRPFAFLPYCFLLPFIPNIDLLNRAQSDMPDGLHNLKLFAKMFPEPYQALVNSLALYAKWLICMFSVLSIFI